MRLCEKQVVHTRYNDKIKWWGRYIDDILLFWTGSEEELLLFYDFLNTKNRNIKLCIEYSQNSINFLDLTISKGERDKLHTTVYQKTTDKNTVLKADSFHPKWLKDNIPFGQFQRLRRICDTDSEFENQAKMMSNRFANGGYEAKIVQSAYKKAQSIPRSELLMTNKQKSSKPEQIYFFTQYSSFANSVKKDCAF